VSRSVSRELVREEDKLAEVRKLVQEQQQVLFQVIADHKAELETKIQTKTRRFGSKQIDKQYQVNSNFRDLAQKTLLALQAGEVHRATEVCTKLLEDLDQHAEDLIIADQSPHGWLAVAKVRSGQELSKSVRKKLAQVEKDLANRKNGGPKKKYPGFSRAGQDSTGRKPDRRLSPEEALHAAAKQIRPGLCSHCHKGLHFFRECPKFWQKVQDTREGKIKPAEDEAGSN
jgi:hypothetical protein